MCNSIFDSEQPVTLAAYVAEVRAATYRFERFWIEKHNKVCPLIYPLSFEAGFGGLWEEMLSAFVEHGDH